MGYSEESDQELVVGEGSFLFDDHGVVCAVQLILMRNPQVTLLVRIRVVTVQDRAGFLLLLLDLTELGHSIEEVLLLDLARLTGVQIFE